MAAKGDIYTVHEKPDAPEPSDRIVLVREGFALWAFVLNLLWLLANRLWRMAGLYVLLVLLLGELGRMAGLSPIAIGVAQLGLQFWLGCVAHDAQRAALARRGYTEIDIVCAESALLAERRYFDRQPLHRAG